ncbi:oligosaccharide flippase family protein [Natroniella acetigena]|uniref:oligosaccharide flippase family protein n=1 Tax=Natroniella acetigena TaxID=52004 RepID=UPI00200A51E5|nr:oligosaccharide flippase family protein [Natroniella acetigena]MCK8827685.1 oligosaccharide flippase family protein [Natroniella acetigena]
MKNKNSTILLYLSKIINLVVKFLIVVVITRKLDDSMLYGRYSYFLTITNYLALFFGFGFFSSIKRLMAINGENKSKELAGVMYIINLLFSIGFALFILIISDYILEEYSYILLLAIISSGTLLNNVVKRMQIGFKKINSMIITETSINGIILISFLLFDLSYIGYLIIYFTTYLSINTLTYFITFRPKLVNIKKNYNTLLSEVKSYGWHVYLGRLASMGTYDLDKIMLESFSGVQYVGYYNLGLQCTTPIPTFSEALMSVFYKDLADKEKIPRKILFYNFIWLLLTSLLAATVGGIIFLHIFGESYATTASLFPWFAAVAFLRGLYKPFNSFFGVKGYGRFLKKVAFILTVANVVFNVLFIPLFGIRGALLATIFALIIDNVAHYYYYKKLIISL